MSEFRWPVFFNSFTDTGALALFHLLPIHKKLFLPYEFVANVFPDSLLIPDILNELMC